MTEKSHKNIALKLKCTNALQLFRFVSVITQPTQETLLQAASLAAYYSKARGSANVPVDYVQVRHLRKPNGAKPGFVIYEGQKTLYVTPDKALVAKLKN